MTPTSSIVTRALLVDLTVSRRTGVRADKQATETVRSQYHANGNVGSYAKKLFPQDPPELKKIGTVINKCEAMHKEKTLAWMTGWRIIPRELHTEYATEIGKLRIELEDAVREFVAALPRLKQEAQAMLGKLYRDEDYPSAGEFELSYGIDVRFMPVPDVNDFRIELDAETLKDLQESYSDDMQRSMSSAVQDAFVRLEKVLGNLVDACTRVDSKVASGAKLAVIRSAVVDNIKELVDVMPTLNIANDPNLEAMRAEVERKLGTLNISDLKENPDARADAKKKADAILRKMQGFMRK